MQNVILTLDKELNILVFERLCMMMSHAQGGKDGFDTV